MTRTELLLRFVTTELLVHSMNDKTIGAEDDLLMTGLVDSLGIMRLIAFIEDEIDVHVPPEDVTIENFRTISRIVEYLEQGIEIHG